MHARVYLQVARFLADESWPEHIQPGISRTAVSRAYYGAYHLSCGFLQSFGCPLEGGGKGHLDARAWLMAAGVRDLAYAAALLIQLHEMRLAADYGLDNLRVEAPATAVATADQAEEIAAILEEVAANSSLCSSIRDALRREMRRRL